MNSSERACCRICGAAIPAESTEKLCPACLLSGALETRGNLEEAISSTSESSPSPHEPSLLPCEFGGYRLLGLLGRGGMGSVYEAEDLATGRRVALKMLGQQLDSPDLRQRFLREGRLAAGVNHPNSLYIFGSEEIDGIPVITMEIAGSGTLKDKVDRSGPLPVTEAVDVILDVISGLESAFAGGVLHRDIKPSNCFIGADGSVKVGDFGLSVSTMARSDTLVTTLGRMMGTPAYASPEQLRGDTLDLCSDIYSVGATLFTLLTGRVPFEGENPVQVVLAAVGQKPKPLSKFREDVPPGLERVVARCLAKEPDQRYPDYPALRNALLPFSSREPEPASMKVRAAAGWIDYLIAFLTPYVILMLYVGNEEFHFQLFMDRTLYSARYHLTFLGLGFLYFTITEGLWCGGLGKHLKGLRVVRKNGRPPGIGRALIRILLPISSIEIVRIPFTMAAISATRVADLSWFEIAFFSGAYCICPWIPILMALTARPENGFATVWDLASGTRVVIQPEGTPRPSIEFGDQPEIETGGSESLGPYRIIREIIPGKWIAATDPVLRRPVWMLKRSGPEPSLSRRNLARYSRLRWLQKVETAQATWDAFEAIPGRSFSSLIGDGKPVPWATLRHWLHDLASELWAATGDQTLPSESSLDHIWITTKGHAVLLDEPWPEVEKPAERIPLGGLAGRLRFLNAVAACVESTSLPLHARPVLQNLRDAKFEKLSFLTGVLGGLLDKPADVSKGIRAGSIFMLPLYNWIMLFVGFYTADRAPLSWYGFDTGGWIVLTPIVLVLAGCSLVQLLELPLRTTASHAIFRLAVINAKGERAGVPRLLLRWAIVWLPLLVPLSLVALQTGLAPSNTAFAGVLLLIFLWLWLAAYSVVHPNQGLHDRLAGTWVVRR